ncbi:hypothetical protein [Rhodopirellula bahusiensis]
MSLVSLGVAEDFSRFRGDDATGVAEDHPDLPTRWDAETDVDWVAEVHGQGWGSPIVVGDRVFVSAVVGEEENTPPQGGLYLGEGVRDPAKGVHHWMVHCFCGQRVHRVVSAASVTVQHDADRLRRLPLHGL